ncbi:uncharacterized protein LOC130752176 [Actinidia eriantha]|uniref:uncharacterized protein LOC130752176 n=1 Tax=Actinidia eriantha TaxID=165200 RepID=UPI002586CEF4|nr:uncharacterized protein LOC130752176 [Actinidia eriantha]
MSGTANNFTPPQGSWRSGQGYGAHSLYPNYRNRDLPVFQRSPSWIGPNAFGFLQESWLEPIGDRVTTQPWGVDRFPDPPLAPIRFLDLEAAARGVNPSRQSIPESPPTFAGQIWYVQGPTQEVESRLTQDEQKRALRKMKKKIYNPTPKRLARRLSLYYRDNDKYYEKEMEKDEDVDRCAICLDDFQPRETVMLTPCGHMFHEDCIVPWVMDHGQCPVCRHAVSK